MKRNNEIVLYDNTNDYQRYDEIRQSLFNEFSAEQDWIMISDVPNNMIQEEIDRLNSVTGSILSTS